MGWENNKGGSEGLFPAFIRNTIGPLLLMLVTPIVSIVLSRAVTSGTETGFFESLFASFQDMVDNGVYQFVVRDAFDPVAMKIIGAYAVFELLLMRIVPGARFEGPVTVMGNVPVYKANGVACYFISLACFAAGAYAELFPRDIVFAKFNELVASMNLFALAFCLMLTIKGYTFPSSTDSGSSGNIVMDYYWGTELYPRIFGWDVKVFTNCRFGMMFWAIGCVSFGFAQYDRLGYVTNAMALSVGLQLVYVTKFFWWETGYFKTIDIMYDRAGYYICWGCFVWLPTLYTSHTSFLVLHATSDISRELAYGLFALGVVVIYINYDIDRQRMVFREENGKCTIWGKPAEYITATYKTEDGTERTSTLLLSGWWGISRKINYLFEITAAFIWSVPMANPGYFVPNAYYLFLIILLADRAYRDNIRCRQKYGKDWNKYCERVPYILIPYIW